MIQAIDHINIVVSDLNLSLEFYIQLLGFQPVRRAQLQGEWIETIVGLEDVIADVVYLLAPSGEPRIELLCYRTPVGKAIPESTLANTIGLRHLALRVGNIAAMYEKLKRAGVEFLGQPITVPDGVVEHEAGKKTLVYFKDPDGVLLELAEYQ